MAAYRFMLIALMPRLPPNFFLFFGGGWVQVDVIWNAPQRDWANFIDDVRCWSREIASYSHCEH